MSFRTVGPLLDETRTLLEEARGVVCGSLESAGEGPEEADRGVTSVLSLYDELRARLGSIDERRVQTLLSNIGRNVEKLGRLADQAEHLRRLRASLARHEP